MTDNKITKTHKQMRTNPYGIKTPKTVEEFRHNLKKYYVTIPHQYPKNEIKDFIVNGIV